MVSTGPFSFYHGSMPSSDPIADADRLMSQGNVAAAIAAIEAAARVGDRDALFQLGFWQIIGEPLPRNLIAARTALRNAAAAGHHEAQLMDAALTANGSGGPASWQDALAQLKKASQDNDMAQKVLSLVGSMHLTPDGFPRTSPSVISLTSDRTVLRVSKLFSVNECKHIINSVADLLSPSLVVDPRSGRTILNPIRNSDEAMIGPLREDLAIRALNLRIAAISDTPADAGEALTILRYRPGQQFRMHSDALNSTRNQRVKTVLVYLNEEFEGGETVFPEHGLSIRPRTGDAIIFSNTLATGHPDQRARHAGRPVTHGVKWLATRWIRSRAFDMWHGAECAP